MRRRSVLGFILVVGLAVSACGGPTLAAQTGPTVVPASSSPTTTTTAEAVAWTVQLAQTQAAQLAAAEEQYATCYTYAALDQGLAGNPLRAGPPVVQSCSTAGLTSVEVQQIQGLIMEAS
jgi:hypothetical protein